MSHADPSGRGPASRQGRIQLCEGISDGQKHDKNKAAKKQKPTGTYLTHTDRYRKDIVYRTQMIRQGFPEWLVFRNGNTSRIDGMPGDEFA